MEIIFPQSSVCFVVGHVVVATKRLNLFCPFSLSLLMMMTVQADLEL